MVSSILEYDYYKTYCPLPIHVQQIYIYDFGKLSIHISYKSKYIVLPSCKVFHKEFSAHVLQYTMDWTYIYLDTYSLPNVNKEDKVDQKWDNLSENWLCIHLFLAFLKFNIARVWSDKNFFVRIIIFLLYHWFIMGITTNFISIQKYISHQMGHFLSQTIRIFVQYI